MPFNDQDVKHLDRDLRKHQDDAAAARRRAEAERDRAQQYIEEGNDGRAQYHTRAAEQLEAQAIELENEVPQMESLKATKEKQINDLEQQKAQLTRESSDRIAAIDNELRRLKGDTFTF